MEIDTQGNISVTKSTDSGCTISPMAIVMKGHGMRAVSKATACTLSEAAIRDVVNGMVARSSTLYPH